MIIKGDISDEEINNLNRNFINIKVENVPLMLWEAMEREGATTIDGIPHHTHYSFCGYKKLGFNEVDTSINYSTPIDTEVEFVECLHGCTYCNDKEKFQEQVNYKEEKRRVEVEKIYKRALKSGSFIY